MLINQKQVKRMIKDTGKQVGKDYLERLEYKVRELIEKSIANSRQFKRLTASELL